MWCPKCNDEITKVIGTSKDYVVERYRKCDKCGYSFLTIETLKYDPTWEDNAAHTDEEIARFIKSRHLMTGNATTR